MSETLYCRDCAEVRDASDDYCFDCGSQEDFVNYTEHLRILRGEECDCGSLPIAAHESRTEANHLRTRIATLEAERDGLKCCGNCDFYGQGAPSYKWGCQSRDSEKYRIATHFARICKHWKPRRESAAAEQGEK